MQAIEASTGQGVIVPRGIWHKVHVLAPAEMVALSPGSELEFLEPR